MFFLMSKRVQRSYSCDEPCIGATQGNLQYVMRCTGHKKPSDHWVPSTSSSILHMLLISIDQKFQLPQAEKVY